MLFTRMQYTLYQFQHRQSQELDIEVASMIEMAETTSIHTPVSHRKQAVGDSEGTTHHNIIVVLVLLYCLYM